LRIVHVSGFFQPELGYQEYYLTRAQAKLGHEVHLVTSNHTYPREFQGLLYHGPKLNVGVQRIGQVAVHRLETMWHFHETLITRGLKHVLRELNPDVLHLHEPCQLMSAVPAWLRIRGDQCTVTDVHTYFWHPSSAGQLYSLLQKYLMMSPTLRWADRVLYVVSGVKRFLEREFPSVQRKLAPLPLGVDTDRFHYDAQARQRIRQTLGIPKETKLIVFCSSLLPNKRIDTMIRGLTMIRKNMDASLLLVGRGRKQYISYLQRLTKHLNLEGHVYLMGQVDASKVYQFHSAADVSVAYGVGMLEVLSMGRPLVSFANYQGQPNPCIPIPVPRWAAVCYDINDPKGFQSAVEKSLKLEQNRWQRAQSHVRQNFSWHQVAIKSIKLYQSTRNR